MAAAAAAPSRLQSVRWSTPKYTARYSTSITSEQFSSPAVVGINSNNATQVVAGFPNGHVYIWSAATGARWFDRYIGPGAILGSPTIADLNGDGQPDITVADTAGDIVGFTFTNKTIFKAHTGDGVHQPGNFATTVVADVNNDGTLDIVQTSWDHYVHVYDGRYLNTTRSTRELPGYPVFVRDTIWSSPVVADLNKDGHSDIVFGYDCDGVQGQVCYQSSPHANAGGYVTALNGSGVNAGKSLPGWPRFIKGQTIWSSPAVTDLDDNGTLDVVVGTGSQWATGGHNVYAFNSAGRALPGWPVTTSGRTMASPAVGDLDGNGKKEVAEVDDNGYLYIFNANGTTRIKHCISNSQTGCGPNGPRLHASPIIANVMHTTNGTQQVIVGGEQHLYVISNLGHVDYAGLIYWSDRKVTSNPFQAAPTYAAVPGKVSTIFVAAGETTFGEVFGWNVGTNYSTSPWPTFHRTMSRTGQL